MKLRWLIPLLSLVIVGGLAFLLKDFLRDNLYVPVIDMIRFASVLLRSLPQALWWWLVITIMFLYATRLLFSHRKSVRQPRPLEAIAPSRARVWMQWVERSQRDDYSQWLLSLQIAQLTLQVIAHQEKLPIDRAKHKLISGRFQLPAGVEDYIKTGISAPAFPQYADLIKRMGWKRGGKPLDLKVEEVVLFLENFMK